MKETIEIGELSIVLTRKAVKNVHLSVHPPSGRVTMVAPQGIRTEVARAYAITRLRWIRAQQARFESQPREQPRKYIERESHYVWGRRHLLTVQIRNGKPLIAIDHRKIILSVRPNTSKAKRAAIMHEWHKKLLHGVVPEIIRRWEAKLAVCVNAYFLQRMRTKWGSCNHRAGTIRLNTELVKKPKDMLEYVIVHEMAHLIEPRHSPEFLALLDKHYPSWREVRSELNALPLAAGNRA